MAPPKLTARQVSEMRRDYSDQDSALTYADLADEYGISEATVRYHLWDLAKPSFQRGPAPKICFDRLKELKGRGLSGRSIARLMGVAEASVRRAARRMEARTA